MKRGKYEAPRHREEQSRQEKRRLFGGAKGLALLLALVLAVGGVLGGTLAYLTAKTDSIKNTFTAGSITINLSEYSGTANEDGKLFTMTPGKAIIKDPRIQVEAKSETCYVFVRLEKSDNFDTFLSYEIEDGWTIVEGTGDVYYRVAQYSSSKQTFKVLKGDQVTVKEAVTTDQLTGLTADTYPTLTVTAYACQQQKSSTETFTAAEAWQIVDDTYIHPPATEETTPETTAETTVGTDPTESTP